MPYNIVRYRPDLREQVLALQSQLWGADLEANRAYFQWKYEQNPYVKSPHIYLVLSDNTVVGMRGFYGAHWDFGDGDGALVCLGAGDLVIAPEHRNRGLFPRLMEFAHNDLASLGVHYLFNLSGSPITQISSMAVGWRSIGLLSRLDWASPSSGWLARTLKKRRGQRAVQELFSPGSSFLNARRARRMQENGFAPDSRPEAMANLAQSLGGDARLRHDRSQRFFEWRFRNPRSIYRFVFQGNTELEGYVALQTPRQGETMQVSIVDWCAVNCSVLENLIRRVIEVGRLQRLTIRASGFAPEIQNMLAAFGFRALQSKSGVRAYKPTVLVKPLGEKRNWTVAGRPLLDLATWDVRMIDSDGF